MISERCQLSPSPTRLLAAPVPPPCLGPCLAPNCNPHADLIEQLADSAEDMPPEMRTIHSELEGCRCLQACAGTGFLFKARAGGYGGVGGWPGPRLRVH